MASTAESSASPSQSSEQQVFNSPFPIAFLDFLKENGIDPSIYALGCSIPRYIRVKPEYGSHLLEIEAEFGCKLEKVEWLPNFFCIPPGIQIASADSYRQGKIYGMDAASGAAVVALNVSSGDHVLDLCAAPGAKLCMLSELLRNSGSLTGVDISRQRLAACRTMLQKYVLGDVCRLFVADGTSFSVLPVRVPLNSVQYGVKDCQNVFKEWNSRSHRLEKRKAEQARRARMTSESNEPELIFYGRHSGVVGLSRNELFHSKMEDAYSGYDKVLVDAECTHDGSIKHIQKYEFWGWDTLQHRLLDDRRISSLKSLQLDLLTNGFRLLKVGGTLVYSTCSLTVAQNESIIEKFLSNHSSAELQEIENAKDWPCTKGRSMEKTVRLQPKRSLVWRMGIPDVKHVKHPSCYIILSPGFLSFP